MNGNNQKHGYCKGVENRKTLQSAIPSWIGSMQHLNAQNGTRYALTFENGKKRRWQFYNFTEKPGFKACKTRRKR